MELSEHLPFATATTDERRNIWYAIFIFALFCGIVLENKKRVLSVDRKLSL
jgi:hypothetical protein